MALCGVYGCHTVDECPVNPTPLLKKHGIYEVLGQYDSAFEHTFMRDSRRSTLSRSCR